MEYLSLEIRSFFYPRCVAANRRQSMLIAERAHGGAGLDTAQKNGGVASAVTMLYPVTGLAPPSVLTEPSAAMVDA